MSDSRTEFGTSTTGDSTNCFVGLSISKRFIEEKSFYFCEGVLEEIKLVRNMKYLNDSFYFESSNYLLNYDSMMKH